MPMPLSYSACSLILSSHVQTGNLLVLSVSRKDNHSDFGLPGGKYRVSESMIATARRELFEEVGLWTLDSYDFTPIFSSLLQKGDKPSFCTTFLVQNWKGEFKQEKNGGVLAWTSPDVLAKGTFGDYNKKLFDSINIDYTTKLNTIIRI